MGFTPVVRAGDKHQRSSSDPQSPSSQPPRRRPRQAARAPDSTSEREEEESSSGGNEGEEAAQPTSVVEQYLSMQADRNLAGGFSTLPQQQFVATGTSGQRKSARRKGKSATAEPGPSRQ